MKMVRKNELKSMLQCQGKACVSIYLPTHRTGQEVQQDPIRLKNALSKVEERLLERGLRRPEIDDMLAPARELVQDGPFWQNQADRLAVLIDTDQFRTYRLADDTLPEDDQDLDRDAARDLEPLVVVGERFHIKPLLPTLRPDQRYYLLAVDLAEMRLFEGTQWGLEEIDPQSLPDSLAEALRYDDPERQLQFHTSTRTPGGIGQRPATFHGQGVSDDEKENILRFFHRVDEAIQPVLQEGAPLVLAGVEHLLPLYREANSYSNLAREAVRLDTEALEADELHERAWPILERRFAAARREAAALYEQLAGAGDERASGELEQVVPAAYWGRIASLFIARGVQRWGSFDPDANELHLRDEGAPGDRDLLDFAAVHTLLNSGNLYLVDRVEMPGDGIVAALFRY
jgi:hypothetical protein